jgi:hypothetical protein
MQGATDICKAVAYWLNYKNLTGLEGLFSEVSLTVPIAEYLRAEKIGALRAEVNHPAFLQMKGRPRQLDFVGIRENEQWMFAIETKYFPTTIQQIVNDIGRLLVLNKPSCGKFLILAGPTGKDRSNSFRIDVKANGRHRNATARFFDYKRGGVKAIKLAEEPPKIQTLFATFLKDYKINSIPNAFEIACVDFYRSKRFSVGIWKIKARQGTGQTSIEKLIG